MSFNIFKIRFLRVTPKLHNKMWGGGVGIHNLWSPYTKVKITNYNPPKLKTNIFTLVCEFIFEGCFINYYTDTQLTERVTKYDTFGLHGLRTVSDLGSELFPPSSNNSLSYHIRFGCSVQFHKTVTIVFTEYHFLNTFTAIVDLSRFNNSCLKSRQRRP